MIMYSMCACVCVCVCVRVRVCACVCVCVVRIYNYTCINITLLVLIAAPDKEMCSALVQQLMNYELEHHILSIFVLTFMLQSNSSSLKWIVHSMMQHVYQGSNFNQQVCVCMHVYVIVT